MRVSQHDTLAVLAGACTNEGVIVERAANLLAEREMQRAAKVGRSGRTFAP